MKDVFVLATGASLNNLTQQEKEYIKTCPTIGVGHYLLYRELIGITPDHFLMVGEPWDHPTRSIGKNGMFDTVARIMYEQNLHTTLYTNERNAIYMKGGEYPYPEDNKYYSSIDTWINRIDLCPNNPTLNIKAIDCGEGHGYSSLNVWATNLSERFWFNSSIGTAINLACVLYPNHNIIMLGNDGGPSGVYFHTVNEINPKDLSTHGAELAHFANNVNRTKEIHYNNLHFNTSNVTKRVTESGNKLFNANKHGWFTKHEAENINTFNNNIDLLRVVGAQLGKNIESLEDVKQCFGNLFKLPYRSVLT